MISSLLWQTCQIYREETQQVSEANRKELIDIIDEAQRLQVQTANPIKFAQNLAKYSKLMQKYEKRFVELGGNIQIIEDKAKALESGTKRTAVKMFPGADKMLGMVEKRLKK